MNPVQNLWSGRISLDLGEYESLFPIDEDQMTEPVFEDKWKICQTPDGKITKIVNCSNSFLKVNDKLLKKDQEYTLVSGETISFRDSFDYVFIPMKIEPKNELKRDREENHFLQDSNDLEKQVKMEDEACVEENFDSNKENQTSELCLNGKEPLENEPQTIWKSSNKRGEKKTPKRRTFGEEICSQNVPKINFSNGNGDEYKENSQTERREGFGEIKYSNGDVDKGNWKNNKREGKGTLTLKNGQPFEGTWIDDVIQPQVTIHYDKGGRYDGEINQENLLREGKGVLKMSNGDESEGDFANEHFEGQGISTWEDGDVYNGEWKNGIRDGWGTMKYGNGNMFECNWKKDKREGKGKVVLENGDILEGNWVKDILQMPVKIIYVNGEKYEGEVSKHSFKRNGKGVMTFKNGRVFDGEWKNDKKDGEGVLIYGNGSTIREKCQWKNDERFGEEREIISHLGRIG